MTLAVQILLYKSSNHLKELMDSLVVQTFGDFELFILDNSVDPQEAERCLEIVEKTGLRHTFLAGDKNLGFAGGHDKLFSMHHSPFVLLVNDDTKLDARYIENAMKRMESDDKIAAVGGLLYRMDGKEIDTSGLVYKSLANVVDRREAVKHAERVFGISGAIALYRRSEVESVGGLFVPDWFMYKEDVDLALRLQEAGFEAWYEPTAIAWHKRGLKAETRHASRPAALRKASYVNQWRVYKRHWKYASFGDKVKSIGFESLRSLRLLVTSPGVFFSAWKTILYES
ncbi:MAG TPA: glycosyltransferase family 2 protein [Verrucomicrobiae bacterium]|nr:glycosyltransferase family 2 protein [Verrucomicrobiae bacterium]